MGTVDEVRGRVQISGDIGEKLDKCKENAEQQELQLIGTIAAFKAAAKALESLHGHVDADMKAVNDGEDPKDSALFPSAGSSLEIASYVKRYIDRAISLCHNLQAKAEVEKHIAAGKTAAYREAVQSVQKYHSASVTRAKQLISAIEELKSGKLEESEESEDEGTERRRARAPGEHPGASPHDDRRNQAAKKQAGAAQPEKKAEEKPLEKKA